jgi:hypothetical protein
VRFADLDDVTAAFDVTLTLMVPLPTPELGAMETHGAAGSLSATHEQLGPLAVTPIVPTTKPADGPYGLPS